MSEISDSPIDWTWTGGDWSEDDFSSITSLKSERWEWTWDKSVKTVILAPIVLFTIIGNFIVLFAFVTRSRDLRSPTHFFIANLALADMLVGMLAMPFLATLQVTGRWYFGTGFCFGWGMIHFWLCSSSILSTLAVCAERYIGVKYPLRHLTIMSRTRIAWIITGVWTLAGVLTLSTLLIWPVDPSEVQYECKPNLRIGSVLIATVGILYIPTIIMMFLYWQIYILATKHLNVLKNGFKVVSSNYTFNVSVGGTHLAPGQSSSGESGISSCGSEDFEQHGHGGSSQNICSSSGSGSSNGDINSIAKNKNRTGSNETLASAVSSRKQINLAKRLAVLVGILLGSYLPFFTAFLIMGFDETAVDRRVFDTLGWIRYFNSCLNPIIYAFAVPAYRKAFKNILKGRFLP